MSNEQKLSIIFAGLAFLTGLAVVAYGSVLTGTIKGVAKGIAAVIELV